MGLLFCIGAPKAGTTTLHRWLDGHPEICMSRPKEPGAMLKENPPSRTEYVRAFFDHREGQETVLGEATTKYFFRPRTIERIRTLAPEARLLATLRDPVHRAYSDWWHCVSRGSENLSFPEAVEQCFAQLDAGVSLTDPDARKKWREASGSPGRQDDRVLHYVEMGHYVEHLRRWEREFPGQLKVLLLEDLKGRPDETYEELCRFLDIEVLEDPPVPPRGNSSFGRLEPVIRGASRSLNLSSVIGALPRGPKQIIRRFLRVRVSRPTIGSDTRQKLQHHYEPLNERLASFLGRDLSHWAEVADEETGPRFAT